MIVVSDFSKKKLVDLLEPGMRVLIDFRHGLGDAVMFMPLLRRLRAMFPDCEFDMRLLPGRQTPIFYSQHEPIATYDIVAILLFEESCEKRGFMTKAEYCCKQELGIPFSEDMDFTWTPPAVAPPLIGVNFQCNSNPAYNVPYGVAEMIWQVVQNAGLVPIEIYFEHKQFDRRNQPYDFVTATTRGVKPSVEVFVGVLQQCRGFIGVNSGSLCMAMAMYPERTLHLHTRHDLGYYTKNSKVTTVNATREFFDLGLVENWLHNTLGAFK